MAIRGTTPPQRMIRENAGRVAQYEGAAFEDWILSVPLPPGVWLHRTPVPVKAVRTGDGWRVVADSARRGLPDFHGGAFGRAVVFDAKRCSTGRWDLAGLSQEQRAHLRAVSEAGSVAGVWLRFAGEEDEDWWVRWADIVHAEEIGGVYSFTRAAMRRWGTRILDGAWWAAC